MSAQPSQSEQSPETQEMAAPAVSLPEQQTTTALALVTQSITELNKVALEVAALEPKYKGVVFDVKTTAGMKAACEARLAIRKPRYTIQKMQKDAKTPLNALKKAIDDQADAVIARITAIEDPIHEQVTNEETRKENEKKAREEAEAKRVSVIHERIEQDIRQAAFAAVNRTSAQIEVLITDVVAIAIDDSFAEFKQQAEGAKATTLIRLRAALANAQTMEKEQQRLADEREKLRIQTVLEETRQAAEREQIAEAQRVAREELERERLRQQAATDAERARIAEEERTAKAMRDAEDARLRAEREVEEARQREQATLNQGRLEEIQGMQHQAMIATSGRLGVRKGGTRECIVDTLEETRQWPVTEEHFGPVFFGAAQKIKTKVIAQIEELLVQWDARAEADRLEAERKAAADAEAQRLADERAQLERDQATFRAEMESPLPVSEEALPVCVTAGEPVPEQEMEATFRPTDEAILYLLTTTYNVPKSIVITWLLSMDLRAALNQETA